ncbi:unnamed protein product, partial [Symbiodinium natans]
EALDASHNLRKLRFRNFGVLQKLRKLHFKPFHSLVFVKGESYRDAGRVEGQRYPFVTPNCFASMVSVLANEDRR